MIWVALISTPVEGNDRGRGRNEAVWWCRSRAGPWKMIGWGIDRQGVFFLFFHPLMHYLHFLPEAAVTGVSLPGSNGFEPWHGAELMSRGRRTDLLGHSRKKRRTERLLFWNPLPLFGNPGECYASIGWGVLDRCTGGALQRPGRSEETTGCLRPEYDRD